MLRASPQLFGKRLKLRVRSDGVNFHATVPQISGVAGQLKFRGRSVCKVAVPNALDPPRYVITLRPLSL